VSATDIAGRRVAPPTGTTRLLAGARGDGRAVSLSDHVRGHGSLDVESRDLVDVVHASGLRGRGGGGFPAAVKLASVRDRGGRAVVVANGAEGEPPSCKDKVLLAYVPHLALDGAVLAARAVGARDAIVAVPPSLLSVVQHAVSERRDARVALRVVAVPETFVAGEETALVRFLNGGPALPTFTPPRPFERGVHGLPTLVQNVETLANIALIARFGADWFRTAGTADESGTVLVTLSGAVRYPGVYEVSLGKPLSELVAEAGGTTAAVQAYLVGGYFGTWISAADAADAVLSSAGLRHYGSSLGARAIVALPAAACGIAESARVADFLSRESAGQCGPCANGLAAVAADLNHLVRRDRSVDAVRLRQRLEVIAGRGACRHPDGAVGFVESAFRVFPGELERHLRGRRCNAARTRVLPIRQELWAPS
jgi:NADH:ubiquinone oxidoreductase subunit F (NADH-binding)